MHCLKYGLTVHNLLQVDIVTLEGERLSLGSSALDSAGFDLLALFTGSEGLLGVVVEVTVRLLPRPPVAKVLLASFDDVESAGRAVADLIGAGIVPAGLEMMDNLSIRAAEDFIHAGYPVDAAAILLCELDGVEADVHEDCERVREAVRGGWRHLGATGPRRGRAPALLGRAQECVSGGRADFPDYYCMDGSIPRRELPRVLHGIAELSREYGLRVANVFHAGDGSMHPLILFDANLAGELERAEALGGRILELCVAVGGSITGEHGVGREKINQMCAQFNADELTLFHAVKAAFDPAGLLNPGKNVAHPASLRRVRRHARPPRSTAVPRTGAFLMSQPYFDPDAGADHAGALLERVRDALARRAPLRIVGGDSKAFLGRPVAGEPLALAEHRGIVAYDPCGLVITARAGTPLDELQAVLARGGQMLACEAPGFGGRATVGGVLASGLSGPRRPWAGAVRDFVLGTRLISGLGTHLRFGGEVMKNVAGYDLSRLLAGSFGCLGWSPKCPSRCCPCRAARPA